MSETNCPVTGHACSEPRPLLITEIDGDGAATVRCCRRCAARHVEDLNRASGSPKLEDAVDFLNAILGPLATGARIIVPATGEKEPACPGCGYTMYDILAGGKAGCRRCHDFCKDLAGRRQEPRPKLAPDVVDPRAIRAMIEEKMEDAVRAEDYEVAALLREQLRRIDERSA